MAFNLKKYISQGGCNYKTCVILAGVWLGCLNAPAETYYLAESDTRDEMKAGQDTSFNGLARWSLDGTMSGLVAAAPGNDYVIPAGKVCFSSTNTVVGNGDYTFCGSSLTVQDGGALHVGLKYTSQHFGAVITNLIVEAGGAVWAESDGNAWTSPNYINTKQTMTVRGTREKPVVFVLNDMSDSSGATTQRQTGFYYLAGSGDLVISNPVTTRAMSLTYQDAQRNGQMFCAADMSAFDGRLILNGSLKNETTFTSAHWNYSENQKFCGTLVMRNNACLTFQASSFFKQPIELEEGGERLWFRTRGDSPLRPVITGPVSGAGDVMVISCSATKNESYTLRHTLVVSNTVWDATGSVTVSNCHFVAARVNFKKLPTFIWGEGDTVTINGATLAKDAKWVEGFDEEATQWPDWSALPLADLEGRELDIATRRSAAMFDGKGALRVVKLPPGASVDTFPVKQFVSVNAAFQADWLSAPEWGIDSEGYLTVKLTRKPDEEFKKTVAAMGKDSTWLNAANWQGGMLPAAGEHCLATASFFSSGELFSGASLTISGGKNYVSRYGLQVEHLYLSAGSTVEVHYENSVTVFAQGHGCSILGTAASPVVFRNPNNYGNNCRLKLPLVGGSDAVVKFYSSDNPSSSSENSSDETSTRVRGWHLEAPSPEYRGRIIVQAQNKVTATNAHYHVFAACEEALGAAPKTLRSDSLLLTNRFTEVVHNNLVTLRNEPGEDLDILSANRGITVSGAAGFWVSNGTMAVASPIRLVEGESGKWGNGTLAVKGTATAQAGTSFVVADGTFKPLVAECFKDARLVFTNAVALAIDPDASTADTFKENGLVNTTHVSVDGELALALTLPAACSEKRVWRIPLMTVPTADAPALVAAFKRRTTFENVPPQLNTDNIIFVATPSPTYAGCSVIKAGHGNVSTILIFR